MGERHVTRVMAWLICDSTTDWPCCTCRLTTSRYICMFSCWLADITCSSLRSFARRLRRALSCGSWHILAQHCRASTQFWKDRLAVQASQPSSGACRQAENVSYNLWLVAMTPRLHASMSLTASLHSVRQDLDASCMITGCTAASSHDEASHYPPIQIPH